MALTRSLSGCLAILGVLGSLGCTTLFGESYYAVQLSEDGYGDAIHFLARSSSAIRTRYMFEASVSSADRCGAFYDLAYFLDDNQVKRLAEVSVARLASGMRLAQSPSWHFSPYPDSAALRINLKKEPRMQWVGMSTTLLHAARFGPSDGPPRTFVKGADGQDCYFRVDLQYFIKLQAPAFVHILVLDVTPYCGSRLVYEQKYQSKSLDGIALKNWVDGLGIQREYQGFLNDLTRGPSPLPALHFADESKAIRNTEPYKAAVRRCRESLNESP
jgi:hypothetical protein